jgi:hypothetical protein
MPALFAFLLLSLVALPIQDDEPKPVLSQDPLTAEQIAVYRAMLADYTKGEDVALNIQEDVAAQAQPTPTPIVHRMDPSVALNAKMVLVDPQQQAAIVKKNDPQNLVMKVIDSHEPVSDSDLDKSINTAFSTGLFTCSEIIFNKKHTRAILEYSFVCGRLCGHGNIVTLKKVRNHWKVSKVCGGWVS